MVGLEGVPVVGRRHLDLDLAQAVGHLGAVDLDLVGHPVAADWDLVDC